MATQNRRADVPAAGKQDTARVTSTVDSHAVTKRLQSELMSLMSATDPGVSAFPDGDSLFSWVGTIQGAADTVYEGMSYKLSLKFPTDYPFKAPTVKFETPCFHPNVDQYGNICLDILKDKWSAAYRSALVVLTTNIAGSNTSVHKWNVVQVCAACAASGPLVAAATLQHLLVSFVFCMS